MKRIENHLLINILEKEMGESLALELIDLANPQENSLIEIYELATKNRYYVLLQDLLKKPVIYAKFEFISHFLNQNIGKKLHLLDYPAFLTEGKTFKHVVYDLFNLPPRTTLKRTGRLVEKFGVRVLNNLNVLKLFVNIQDIDQILNLDHSIALNTDYIKLKYDRHVRMSWLNEYYSAKRIFKLLAITNFDKTMLVDSSNMYWRLKNDGEDMKAILPKKPKDVNDIHNHFLSKIYLRESENRSLNQSLRYLHGRRVGVFEIEVPESLLFNTIN